MIATRNIAAIMLKNPIPIFISPPTLTTGADN
jgi:hypothetical protein